MEYTAGSPATLLPRTARVPIICYIHTRGVLAPQVRFLADGSSTQLATGLAKAVNDWPDYDLIELYDEWDRLLAKHERSDGRPKGDA